PSSPSPLIPPLFPYTTLFRSSGADAAPIPPRFPEHEVPPVPADLAELAAFSRDAARRLDHVSSWRAVTAFARSHWLDESASAGLARKSTRLNSSHVSFSYAVF